VTDRGNRRQRVRIRGARYPRPGHHDLIVATVDDDLGAHVNKLRFGIFMPPFNSPPTQNATSSLQRNLETLQLLDRLGYDEAWIGEHHSAGTEIIADPLTFIAHAGALTRHIKLGPAWSRCRTTTRCGSRTGRSWSTT
jgi:hypothetical protein